MESSWISLMDYATEYGVSLSTLRRHIKAGKIEYKIENGRYLLKSPFAPGVAPSDRGAQPSSRAASHAPAQASAQASGEPSSEVRELRARLQRAQEEIAELKMLVAIYEEQPASQKRAAPNANPAIHAKRVNGY
jgi:hypothetical protein